MRLCRSNFLNIAGLGGALLLPGLTSVVLAPYMVSEFGPAAAGTVFIIESVGYYARLGVGGYLQTFAQQYVASRTDHRVIQAWVTSVVIATAAALVGFVIIGVVHTSGVVAWGAATIWSGTINPLWVLRGTRRYAHYAVFANGAAVVRLVIAFAGFVLSGDITWYFRSLLISDLLVLIITNTSVQRLVEPPSLRMTVRGLAILPGTLATQAYTNLDLLLIAAVLGKASAGVYGAVYKLQYVGLAAYAVIAQFMLPRPELYSPGSLRATFRWLIAAGAIWPLGLYAALALGRGILPHVWTGHLSVIVLLSLQIGIAMTALPAILTLLARRPSAYSVTSVGGLCCNALLLLMMLRPLHLIGAALATVAAELVVTAVAAAFAVRLLRAARSE